MLDFNKMAQNIDMMRRKDRRKKPVGSGLRKRANSQDNSALIPNMILDPMDQDYQYLQGNPLHSFSP